MAASSRELQVYDRQLYAGWVTSTAARTAASRNDSAAPDATYDAAAQEWADVTASESSLRRFLHGLPGVDQVGAEQRAASLGTRSIKTTAKAFAIDLAITMVDLTTLEGQDTPGKVRALSAKAMRPDPGDPGCPSVAAVCVYPDMVATAKQALGSSGVHVASVATAFPSGRAALDVKLADTRDAVHAGADEIDMVIDRGAFLAGHHLQVFEEIVAVRAACARADGGSAHLKVIFETGELQTYDNVRRASWLAMMAGAHFIKTSTGKVQPAATPPVTLVMLEAVRDFREQTGRMVGVKPAGGIRTSKDAIKYLVMVNEVAGPAWLDPDWFRFGASTLLNDLLMQRTRLATGRYSGPDYFTLD
jgi:deoxyribose-phosphate aldolase